MIRRPPTEVEAAARKRGAARRAAANRERALQIRYGMIEHRPAPARRWRKSVKV